MAVRQQQRRGTASQWTAADPILSAAEIGYETDTNKFKIGNGTTRWVSLVYFTADAAGALEDLIDGAPGLLDTLNELAAAVGDDANFFSTVTSNIATAKSQAISTASGDATTKANNAKSGAEATAASDATSKANAAQSAATTAAASDATTKVAAEAALRVSGDSASVSTAASDATSKANAAQSAAEATAASALSTHNSATLNVHGIPDTTVLATLTDVTNAVSGAEVDQSTLAGTGLLWDGVNDQFTIDTTVATKTYADNAASTAVAAVVNSAPGALDTLKELADALTADQGAATTLATLVGTKAPLESPTFTGTVSGVTKAHVGLANVDNTTDANKPVSTATQTALDFKAPLASPTFTGTVSGITKSMVGLDNVDNTADASKPVSTAQQTALDLKAPLASPTLTGVPAAPTASVGTNTTQVATTAFVKAAIQDISSLNLVLDGGGV